MDRTFPWRMLLALGAIAAWTGLAACDDDGGGPDGGSDTDADTGTDTGTDSDTGSEVDLCQEYPDADNDFAEGSVIRNYELLDRDDVQRLICELAGGPERLLFLAITETT